MSITIRPFVKKDLGRFINAVAPLLPASAVNFALITDTHDKAKFATTYYGPTGYWHVREQGWLSTQLPLALRVHLGDLVDGSESPWLTKLRLRNIMADYRRGQVPFLVTKGNHDDNDKFAEKQPGHRGSFLPEVAQQLIFAADAIQRHVAVSREGLLVQDFPGLRIIVLNTADVPLHDGRKIYDVKKTLAVSFAQLRDFALALKDAQSRDVLIMSHAPAMKQNGQPALKFNGRAVHELLRAFNLHASGLLNTGKTPEFGGQLRFDFTQTTGKIIAYLAGHYHLEADYQVNGIHYSLQNTSALMGRHHGLTTKFNRRYDRRFGTPSEYAGYVVSVDVQRRLLSLYGYGAASRVRRFVY
ncbi:metallophosphoesterase [Lacticaseibacillus parahuelsenbergensis]|uniref:Metallophosphoesterase n=1 Tax=Lacticaseibacillus parahuelsenbergensis TaxID=3068305 RepID=A0ABY9L0M3_9LACO|nr:metallophosphoesterase [Lacticaseibacillus sp. NCIMB 15471]WLV77256.1 metallophosphoesterase [Lacticaseibacillus sp. NCIMB 15471]